LFMGLMNFEGSAKVEWAQLLRPLTMLADFLYPPGCAAFGTATGGHRGLCPKCWSGVRFIERPYCEVLGIPFSHDLGTGILSAEAIANPPPFDRLRSAAFHDNAARNLVHGLKYRDRTDLAPGKPLLPATLLRTKRTAQQVGLSANAREDNVRGAFSIAKRPGRGRVRPADHSRRRCLHDRRHRGGGGQDFAQGRSRRHRGFDLCKGSCRTYMTERKPVSVWRLLNGTRHYLYPSVLWLLRPRQVPARGEGRRVCGT
jgi:hypothetical protein